MELRNKNVLITGGSSGIGKETARQFIDKGANVVITGRDANKLKEVANELDAIPLPFDISDLKSIPIKAKEAVDLLNGKVDVLINNAGIGVFPLLGEITEENLMDIYSTNVFGLILLTQEILPVFKKQNHGDIINIGSTASSKGFVRGSVYASSKFAVRGITQSWQAELRKDNIRVCLVNPSEVATAFADKERKEREEESNKLGSKDVAHAIISIIEMRKKGFIPEVTIWATNPF
ncbi:SDR family NAD(P)-dependent oxidoreductase [Hyunsoonleella sp. SJ7]|uniref:SDR family NAD(P)-dependent oxidoreductase n=1 Tax=Hyunsoonleella aquatilis TaxID=2762758 RepID=A0A923HCE1_9FLAO|nr:SDR family NAD(P)-dependent oxidoreductase [Hyunsoonleella aquatilis]MBC3760009.1 SDR family NAD(P)-dependent oxidoreductase [Hyunsoonleella aquatilis]